MNIPSFENARIAAIEGNANIVKKYLIHGGNVNRRNNRRKSLLDEAMLYGRMNIVKLLIMHGATINRNLLHSLYTNQGRNYIANVLGKRKRAENTVRKINTKFRRNKAEQILTSPRLFGAFEVNTPKGRIRLPNNVIHKFAKQLVPRKIP